MYDQWLFNKLLHFLIMRHPIEWSEILKLIKHWNIIWIQTNMSVEGVFVMDSNKLDTVAPCQDGSKSIGYPHNRYTKPDIQSKSNCWLVGRNSNLGGFGLCCVLGTGYNAQKSLFWPILHHPKFCATNMLTYLPYPAIKDTVHSYFFWWK